MANLMDVLDKLKPADPVEVDFENYTEPSEFPPPIPAGVYTLRQGKPAWEATKDGKLQAVMTHVVVAPGEPEDGHKISFDRVSNGWFQRQSGKGNMMLDHIRALGNTNRPNTHQEWADAVEAGTDQNFKASIDWEAGCNHKGTSHEVAWEDKENVFRVRGMRKFPTNGSGKPDPEIECPTCHQTVLARERIGRRIPA